MLTIIDQINKQSCPKLDPQIEQKVAMLGWLRPSNNSLYLWRTNC